MDRLAKLKPLGTFIGLAICAYLAAGTVTTLVAEWRRPVPPLPEIKTPKRAARFNRQISAIADRNLAGTVREVVEEVKYRYHGTNCHDKLQRSREDVETEDTVSRTEPQR